MALVIHPSVLGAFPGLRFFVAEIEAAAQAHTLDPQVVAAIVLQESSACTDAFRHEKDFWNRYLKRLPEWNTLNPRRTSSSYGLMQIMLPVAVERGFPKSQDPEILFQPTLGLEYGCRHLRYLIDRMAVKYPQASEADRLQAVLASYNGGFQGPDALRPNNKKYALNVLQLLRAITKV